MTQAGMQQAAEKLCQQFERDVVDYLDKTRIDVPDEGERLRVAIQLAIVKAVHDERERCAKIAESMSAQISVPMVVKVSTDWHAIEMDRMARAIAEEIRRGE